MSPLYWRSQRNSPPDVQDGRPRRGTTPSEALEAQGAYGAPGEAASGTSGASLQHQPIYGKGTGGLSEMVWRRVVSWEELCA